MADPQEMLAWRGREVIDVDGDRIGRLEEIYLDSDTGEPHWAAVKTGLVGSKLSLVPLSQAVSEADRVAVPFEKRRVKDAPTVDSGAELSAEEESVLYRHYDMDSSREGERRQDGPPYERGHDDRTERERGRDDRTERGHGREHGRDDRNERERDREGGERRAEGRGGELGRTLGEAARNVGQAAMREVRGREGFDDRGARGDREGEGRERHGSADSPAHREDRHEASSAPEDRSHREGRAEPPDRGQRSEPLQSSESGTDRPRGRLRRHVTTEYLSETGEVERRETHTEEERPEHRER